MVKLYAVSYLLCLGAGVHEAQAQASTLGTGGARAAGLGQVSTVLENDVWAATNNSAALGVLTRPMVGFGAANKFLLPSLNTASVVAAVPLGHRATAAGSAAGVPAVVAAADAPRFGVVGVMAQRFGGKLYAEQALGVAYGYQLGTVRVGARVEVLQTSLEGLGSRRTVAASLAGQADIIPRKLTFGATLYNLNQARLAPYQDERVPTVLRAGLGWRTSEKVLVLVETEKDVEQDANFKAGLEYRPVPVLALRGGLATRTHQTTGGVGFKSGVFQVDYAAAWQQALGLSQQVSIALQWEQKQP
ncbi:hypothetical protein HMJ29_11390 [Hymenobacter taeanensis]|uniref:PorV/PorQ family protein n=1 Tax=Hymenobacter taeanensis TaxID=2735321 RepID=A0A6M6BHI2_9BACT|nr:MULTISPECIES: hypothetical protein [Hymenobacter]QJX47509.1 hypothetical protein HMJ29_11390 [Hymenobacter taeanensis]UOQ83008.1 hypothetical protein MUN83_09715 [Hymenobacter sp. 5414T-23]